MHLISSGCPRPSIALQWRSWLKTPFISFHFFFDLSFITVSLTHSLSLSLTWCKDNRSLAGLQISLSRNRACSGTLPLQNILPKTRPSSSPAPGAIMRREHSFRFFFRYFSYSVFLWISRILSWIMPVHLSVCLPLMISISLSLSLPSLFHDKSPSISLCVSMPFYLSLFHFVFVSRPRSFSFFSVYLYDISEF